jgi:hypothetical protein
MSSIIPNTKITPDQIKTVILNLFKPGDQIHICKKSRKPIVDAPAIFISAYNHFITIEADINDSMQTFTVTYSDLYTGDTVINELADKLEVNPA